MIFQKLVILLRDWQSHREFKWGYYDDTTTPSDQTANLKHKLLGTDDPAMHKEAQRTRQGITSCFQDISLFAMPHPGRVLPDPPNDLGENWDETFRTYVIKLVHTLLLKEKLENSVKHIFGTEVTGNEMKLYVKIWANLISNSNDILPSQTIFERTIQIYYDRRIEIIVNEYEQQFKAHLDLYPKGIQNANLVVTQSVLAEKALKAFKNFGAFGGKRNQQEFENKLTVKVGEVLVRITQLNNEKLEAENQRQLTIIAEQATQKAQEEKNQVLALSIQQAKDHINQIVIDLAHARGVLAQIRNSQYSFTKQITVEKIKKKKALGITYKRKKTYVVETVYSDEAFQSAVKNAENVIKDLVIREENARANLELIKNT